jgi:hypothetical protein
MIAQMDDNGVTARAIFCHWDGYLDNNGRILQEHYDAVKTQELIRLGDLSSLRANIGEAHPFSKFDLKKEDPDFDEMLALHEKADALGWCTFHVRDKGESQYNAGHRTYSSLRDLLDDADGCGAQFVYILRDSEWFYTELSYTTGWTELQSLAPALEALKVAD